MIVNNNQAGNPVFEQTTHSQYPVLIAMNSDFSKEHPSYPDTPVFHQQRHGMSRQIITSSPNIAGHPGRASWPFFSSRFKLSTSLNVHVLEKKR